MNELELKQWKEDVMNSLCKYDANSVEEVYQYGINKGRADEKRFVAENVARTVSEKEAEIRADEREELLNTISEIIACTLTSEILKHNDKLEFASGIGYANKLIDDVLDELRGNDNE